MYDIELGHLYGEILTRHSLHNDNDQHDGDTVDYNIQTWRYDQRYIVCFVIALWIFLTIIGILGSIIYHFPIRPDYNTLYYNVYQYALQLLQAPSSIHLLLKDVALYAYGQC